METQIGYKVCRISKDRIISALDLGHTTDYKIGKTVYPKTNNGPFAVFDNLNSAMEFVMEQVEDGDGIARHVFKYEYEEDTTDYCLWYRLSDGFQITRRYGLPEGTRFAKSVKLLEMIKE